MNAVYILFLMAVAASVGAYCAMGAVDRAIVNNAAKQALGALAGLVTRAWLAARRAYDDWKASKVQKP